PLPDHQAAQTRPSAAPGQPVPVVGPDAVDVAVLHPGRLTPPTGRPTMRDEVVAVDDAARFRQILGCFPTGVTIVTAIEGGRPVGLAVGSFFSVSLDAPLVGFCVMTTSNTWPAIERQRSFGVSILADDQVDVCRRLAGKEPDKFDALSWSPGPVTGSPLIEGAVAHLDCDLEQQHRA